jgi:orotate phosphoribosyltransferase
MDVMDLLAKTGAILDGHFLLSSGLHSERYLQCAKLLQYPPYAEEIGRELAKRYLCEKVDLVVGPALGGIVIAHEVARALRARCIFVERYEGRMTLRRGFEIMRGEDVLIVEDVMTTGGSIKETIEIVKEYGGRVVGVAVIVDRSGGKVEMDVPIHSLATIEIKVYEEERCPLCARSLPIVKPGSRVSR